LPERRERERHAAGEIEVAEHDRHRDEERRKPEPLAGEWRGSGVCGDRHTD
jgi:hypothetical protein